MSLSARIFIGLFLGIATGLFFGEMAAFLNAVGEVFIRLLKMAVLPYIMVALISGLGKLNYGEAKTLFLKVGAILLLIWLLTFVLLFLLPLTFPRWETASFFSTSLLEEPKPFDFLEFIPANPFYSMANSIVPAVVFFSIAVGVAVIGIERKQNLIDFLDVLVDALARIMRFVMLLTPLGVFAIAAGAAGTIPFDQLGELQVYLLTYAGATLLMTFCVLPALVTTLTPVSLGQLLSGIKDALITAFATDELLLVLPILADRGKQLIRDSQLESSGPESPVDVIVPASFNFPHAGKLLQLSFVLFAAWFTDTTVSLSRTMELAFAGLFSFFGKPVVAMPFLLDLVRVPADMFQLYLASGVLVARFGTLVSVMQTFVLSILGAFAIAGALRLRFKSLLLAMLITAPILVAFLAGARLYYGYALENTYEKDRIIRQMQNMEKMVAMEVFRTPMPALDEDLSRPVRERIRTRRYLRACYFGTEVRLPFTYFNEQGDLVGFDVAMAQSLAAELGVALQFVPITETEMADALKTGVCDIVMSAIPVTPDRTDSLAFSTPYLDLTLGLIVRDFRREEFETPGLTKARIAVPNIPYYIDLVRKRFPYAEVKIIDRPGDFFGNGEFDALAFSAEMGAAWSLLHPQYSVVVPHGEVIKIPIAYPIALEQEEWLAFVDTWIELQKKQGTIQKLYDYWILGRDAVPARPRWSVIRNVLGWVN